MGRKKVEESSNEASFDIENQATSMENQLTNLRALSPACCPLHHGSKNLEAMEDHKLRYLKCFLDRTKVVGLKDYLEKIKEREGDLRHYYEDTKKFNIAAFVNIILVDAAFLPFFILEDLYNLTGAQTGEPSIIELSYRFFQQALRLENLENSPAFRKSFMPPDPKKPLHFVDFIRTLHLPKEKKNGGLQGTPSMTKLHQAGVNSRKTPWKFQKIEIHDYTELTHRNLIAFEQCHCVDKYISDYVFILDKFVNTPKDVELLVENRIVVNTLGDNNKVSIMINKLCSKVAPNHENYYFGDLAGKLNEYCKKTTNRWKANLRQKYFNTPWAAISLFAAVILLILTVIQTVCSIISVIDQVLAYVKEWIWARFMLVCVVEEVCNPVANKVCTIIIIISLIPSKVKFSEKPKRNKPLSKTPKVISKWHKSPLS
ncbi:hypothetical protein PRUPE_1G477700 [Prunus persica]|uniref:Uncharacterized protein n=1 Tax=Prunus persica TaxID=3760 RepID=A0A251RE87_PRUPE|nr:hypothetical protein PRUPE_1G477700 [Prunus persica]